MAKWAATVAQQAEDAARLEHPNQSSEDILSNNWRKRWSDTDLKPWEEETEVGTFEVLDVCNILLQMYSSPSNERCFLINFFFFFIIDNYIIY